SRRGRAAPPDAADLRGAPRAAVAPSATRSPGAAPGRLSRPERRAPHARSQNGPDRALHPDGLGVGAVGDAAAAHAAPQAEVAHPGPQGLDAAAQLDAGDEPRPW